MRYPRALNLVRASLPSRNEEMLTAACSAAGTLAALPNAKADDIRDQLASLLASRAPQKPAPRSHSLFFKVRVPQSPGTGGARCKFKSDLLNKIEMSLRIKN